MPAHDSSREDHAPPPTASLSAQPGHDIGPRDDGVIRRAVAASDDAPPAPAPAPLTVGAYEVLDVLGRGGMGVVYRARHRTLGQEVALKMILAGVRDPSALAHLPESERRTWQALWQEVEELLRGPSPAGP